METVHPALEGATEGNDEQRSRVGGGIEAAQRYLLEIQHPDGHWCGELEGDTILESEYIMAMYFIGRFDEPKVRKAGNYIREKQLDDGGWAIYPGGPPEVSSSVKAYFTLKLLGDSPDAPHMQKARRAVLDLGGIEACNSFTKIYLAIFGQWSWKQCPAVPAELILFPRWFYINVYEMSSWSRAILIPLSIIRARKPHCAVPQEAGISELRSGRAAPPDRALWSRLFHGLDAGLKLWEKMPLQPSREFAIKRAEQWTLERLRDSDGLGAIFPPIVNTIYALRALGYEFDHPTVAGQVRELERLEIEEGDTLRVQPCFSPVWDTAIALNAMIESGMPRDDPALVRSARWLLSKRGNDQGDWRIKNGGVRKAGWFFEYANPFYPDCDTTSQVITALAKVDFPEAEESGQCGRSVFEAHEWHLSMQNRDGGWAAFDRGCDKEILTHVPFADHNAMLDPSTSDLTARGLEAMACLGFHADYGPARKAIEFLRREQETDGSWFGRWGCNYIYGTWLALWGLRSIGENLDTPWARQAADWLRGVQNEDGGWGELPASYDDPSLKGKGPSTASQTAWAVLGLLAAGDRNSSSLRRGVDYLLSRQLSDGSWYEEHWTGTGFPSVFYLRYHMYPIYFPLLALGEYLKTTSSDRPRASARRTSKPQSTESEVLSS